MSAVLQVKITNHQLVEKLKMAENQLSSLQQQHSHLVDLSKNQQLEEREALAFKVQDLEMCLRDKTNTIQVTLPISFYSFYNVEH